jgi:hypothetical protein
MGIRIAPRLAIRHLFIGLIMLTVNACDSAPPLRPVEDYIRNRISLHAKNRVKLLSVKKIDGRTLVGSSGEKLYEFRYAAAMEFIEDAWAHPAEPWTTEPADKPSKFGGTKLFKKGERTEIKSSVIFEKYESGWKCIC